MSRKRHITLDDLPESYKEQARRKLGLATGQPKAKQTDTPSKVIKRNKRTPNKTESDYNNRELNGKGMYEAVTLHLAGGSRYTPDYMTVDENGRIDFHEVKGSYRFHSHGRARTAFLECVVAFPMFGFTWAKREKDGSYIIEVH